LLDLHLPLFFKLPEQVVIEFCWLLNPASIKILGLGTSVETTTVLSPRNSKRSVEENYIKNQSLQRLRPTSPKARENQFWFITIKRS
jgi:hypothetical protein